MPIFVDPAVAPPVAGVTITSADGYLSGTLDVAHAGVLLKADMHTLTVKPKWVQFIRIDSDGTVIPVRSGDLARSPGGYAIAYDQEAPLGVNSNWYAIPYYADGTIGATLGGVGITVPAPATGVDDPSTWIKSVEDPALSLQVAIDVWGDLSQDVYTAVAHVQGRQLPVGTFDTLGGYSGAPVFALTGLDQLAALQACVASGQLLIQVAPTFNRPSFYAICTGLRITDLLNIRDAFFGVAMSLTQIDRPDTLNQGLRIPGKSYDDRLAAYPLYSSVPARQYRQAV